MDYVRRQRRGQFGAIGGPKWDDASATVRPEQGLLDIRAHLGVLANIRPVKSPSGLPAGATAPQRLRGRRYGCGT